MIKTIKLTSIFLNNTKADGTALIDKNGKNFFMCNIQWEGKKASMFLGDNPYGKKDLETLRTWTAGETHTVSLEQKGDFLNFRIPSRLDLLEARVTALEGIPDLKQEKREEYAKDIKQEMTPEDFEILPF